MDFFEYLCAEAGMTAEEIKLAKEKYDQAIAATVAELRPSVTRHRAEWKRATGQDT